MYVPDQMYHTDATCFKPHPNASYLKEEQDWLTKVESTIEVYYL